MPAAAMIQPAITNTPETLDKALTRAGRFDREIVIPAPKNWKTRKTLFEHFTKGYNLADDVSLTDLAKETSGFTGADIEAVCNEAGLIALANDNKTELVEQGVFVVTNDSYTPELVAELKEQIPAWLTVTATDHGSTARFVIKQ